MPPTAKPIAKVAAFPSKVNKNCTLNQLRAEATFRGLDLGTVPLSKTQLLDILGDGSISSKAAAEKQKTLVAKAKISKTAPTAQATKTLNNKKAPSKKKASSKTLLDSKEPPSKNKATKSDIRTAAKKKVSNGSKEASKQATSPSKKPKKKCTPTKQTTLNFASASKPPPQIKKTPSVPLSGTKRKKAPLQATFMARKSAKTGGPKKVSSAALVDPALSSVAKKKTAPAVAPILSFDSVAVSQKKNAPGVASVVSCTQRKAPPQQILPRISKRLTVAQLKEEATARQLFDKRTLPKSKADLLHHLVDGSIHVAETTQYKEYQAILQRLEDERPELLVKSMTNHQAEFQKQDERRQKRREQERVKEEQEQAAARQTRSDEIARQACLHTLSFPQVHSHSLAKHSQLKMNGSPRRGCCDVCPHNHFFFGLERKPLYTCEICDYDICTACFNTQNMTPAERLKHEEKKRIEEQRERAEQVRREAEETRRWDAHQQFKTAICKPNPVNKNLGTKGHKFVVWCSDGDAYQGPPMQNFDTSWKTAKEANDRARYLFFWKNPWGIDPREVSDDNGFPKATHRDGLSTYTVEPADSSCWTVGVVPTVAFHHLPEASDIRHAFDDERDTEYSGYGGLSLCL